MFGRDYARYGSDKLLQLKIQMPPNFLCTYLLLAAADAAISLKNGDKQIFARYVHN